MLRRHRKLARNWAIRAGHGAKVIAMTAIDFFIDTNLGTKAKSAFDPTHA